MREKPSERRKRKTVKMCMCEGVRRERKNTLKIETKVDAGKKWNRENSKIERVIKKAWSRK